MIFRVASILLWHFNVSKHDDVIKWKHFPRYWPFVREIHRSPVNSPHKGQWRGALMFSLIYAWINDWVNNREAGDLRRYRAPLWRQCNDTKQNGPFSIMMHKVRPTDILRRQPPYLRTRNIHAINRVGKHYFISIIRGVARLKRCAGILVNSPY